MREAFQAHGMLASQVLAGGNAAFSEGVMTDVSAVDALVEDAPLEPKWPRLTLPLLHGGLGLRGELFRTLDATPAPPGLDNAYLIYASIMGLPQLAVAYAGETPQHAVWSVHQIHSAVVRPPQKPSLLAQFEALLQNRRKMPHSSKAALTRQLKSLLADEQELQDEGVRPALASFNSLLNFIRDRPNNRHPNLSIDREGRFVAAWQPHKKAKLSISFQSSGKFAWTAVELGAESFQSFSGNNTDEIPAGFAAWMAA